MMLSMSRHVPRRDRWDQRGPTEFASGPGLRVYFQRGAWWAAVAYRVRPADAPPDALAAWEPQTDTLGPFKRPRNAMVEAERHATFLERRHRDNLAWGV
jgi:hypothetical protein